jgi:hypothetical protein
MTFRSVRIATTHAIHGQQPATLENLKHYLDTIDRVIIPVYSDNDIRTPPIGRVTSGRIVDLWGGGYALDLHVELFGPDFIPGRDLNSEKRILPLYTLHELPGIWCETSCLPPEKISLIRDVCTILGAGISSRNAIGTLPDEIPAMTISIGILKFGYIADSCLKLINQEKIHLLTGMLGDLYLDAGSNRNDQLLIFDLFVADMQVRTILVEVIITNPSEKKIESFFGTGLRELDRVLTPYYLSRLHPEKIVIQYCEERFRVIYALQGQGIPMVPRSNSVFDI